MQHRRGLGCGVCLSPHAQISNSAEPGLAADKPHAECFLITNSPRSAPATLDIGPNCGIFHRARDRHLLQVGHLGPVASFTRSTASRFPPPSLAIDAPAESGPAPAGSRIPILDPEHENRPGRDQVHHVGRGPGPSSAPSSAVARKLLCSSTCWTWPQSGLHLVSPPRPTLSTQARSCPVRLRTPRQSRRGPGCCRTPGLRDLSRPAKQRPYSQITLIFIS